MKADNKTLSWSNFIAFVIIGGLAAYGALTIMSEIFEWATKCA